MFSKVVLLLLASVMPIYGLKEECDITQAERCAVQLQTQFDEAYMEFEAQTKHHSTTKLSDLCRSVIQGNNITQCFVDNSKLCSEVDSKYIKTQWEETSNDVLNFCNSSICPNLQEFRTCQEKIYEKGIQDGQVERFCRTFNESIVCANSLLDGLCLFNITFYYSLLAGPTRNYYGRACISGCKNLDATIAAIQSCWFHNNDRSLSDCERHVKFKSCLHKKADICPEIGKLLPKHIKYDEFDITCTTTSTTTTTAKPEIKFTTITSTTSTSTIQLPETTSPLSTVFISKETTQEKVRKDAHAQAIQQNTTEEMLTSTLNVPIGSTSEKFVKPTESSTKGINVTETINTSSFLNTTRNNFLTTSTNPKDKLTTTYDQLVTTIVQENSTLDERILDIIQICLPKNLKESSSWQSSNLNFANCMSILSAVLCFTNNMTSIEESYTLNSLLPPYIQDFMKNGSYKRCHTIVTNYASHIHRIEQSCGRARDTGCTGHNYGLMDCTSGSIPTIMCGNVVTTIFFMCGFYTVTFVSH